MNELKTVFENQLAALDNIQLADGLSKQIAEVDDRLSKQIAEVDDRLSKQLTQVENRQTTEE